MLFRSSIYKKSTRPVKEAMSTPVITVQERSDVGEVARIMLEERVNRMPVVKDGQVTGMISRSDILRALVDNRKR